MSEGVVMGGMPRNIAATSLAFMVNLGITFVLTPFIVGTIGLEAFGFVSLGLNFINYANLAVIALNSMAGRFISIEYHKNNWQAANSYLTSILIADIFACLFVTLLGAVMLVRLEYFIDVPAGLQGDVKRLFALLIVNYFLSIFGTIYSIGTFITNRLYLSSFRQAESRIVQASILLLLFSFLEPSLAYVGLGYIAATVYTTLFNLYYTRKLTPRLVVAPRFFDFGSVKTVLRAGVWNTVTETSQVLLQGLDLLIANVYLGATAMATLALAKTVPTAILALIAAISFVFLPVFTRTFAVGPPDLMVSEVSRSIRILSVVSTIPIAILLCFGEALYSLWIPSADARTLQTLSIVIVVPLVLSGPVNGVYLLFTVTNRLRANAAVLAMSAVVNVVAVIVLLNTTDLGYFAIAGVSSMLSVARSLFFTVPVGAMYLGLNATAFYSSIARGVVAFAITALLGFVVGQAVDPSTWLLLVLCGLATVTIGMLACWVIVFERDERIAVRTLSRRFFSRFGRERTN